MVGARLSPALPASLQLGMLYDQERFERAPEEMEAISVLFPSTQMRSVEYSCCAGIQEGAAGLGGPDGRVNPHGVW